MNELMDMVKDAIGLVGIELEDRNKTLPALSVFVQIRQKYEKNCVKLVEIDFDEYRQHACSKEFADQQIT